MERKVLFMYAVIGRNAKRTFMIARIREKDLKEPWIKRFSFKDHLLEIGEQRLVHNNIVRLVVHDQQLLDKTGFMQLSAAALSNIGIIRLRSNRKSVDPNP
jgi:hypothetical protein